MASASSAKIMASATSTDIMTSQQGQAIYIGIFIWSSSSTRLEILDGAVLVDESGRIVQVLDKSDDKREVVEHIRDAGWNVMDTEIVQTEDNQFFFPGFIDTHIHAPQFPNAGIFGKSTLLDWLKTYTYPMETCLSDLTVAKQVYEECISTSLAHGTTTACYYATIDVKATNLLASLCFEKGQRGLIGRVCMDHPSALVDYYRDESVEASQRANELVINHMDSLDSSGQLLAPVLTPRSAVSCTSEQLFQLRDLAKSRDPPLRIQTHLSENVSELQLVHRMWPDHKDYTTVYDAHGLLTPRTILAHAIHLSQSERDLIAKRGAKVSHCPVSNGALGSGLCCVRQLLDSGIVVGLGSDISGGYSASILEAARQASLVSRLVGAEIERQGSEDSTSNMDDLTPHKVAEHDRIKLSVEEVLWMATRGGAEIVGWKDMLGAFEVGMCFDAQLVAFDKIDGASRARRSGLGNFKVFPWQGWEEKIAKWLFCGDDRNTVRVWTNGVLVHER